MFERSVDFEEKLRKSFVLLGPRQTGKSTLLQTKFPDALQINLLSTRVFRQLSAAPEQLQDIVQAHVSASASRVIIIDEVQKLPVLMDEVQDLLATMKHENLRFIPPCVRIVVHPIGA
jgi:uncharacterized protein